MSTFTLSLSDTQATLETVGGKGMSLAKMIGAGMPVPDGFHVTTEAYRQFVAANGLQTKILAAVCVGPVNTEQRRGPEFSADQRRVMLELTRIDDNAVKGRVVSRDGL